MASSLLASHSNISAVGTMIFIREGPTACFCLYWSQQGGGAKSGGGCTPITVETGGASRTEMLPEAVRPIQQNVFLSASSGPHRNKNKVR